MPDELELWAISSTAYNAESLILNMGGARNAVSAPCDGELPAHERWSIGDRSGRILCLPDPAVIFWTYDGAKLIGRASRFDGDMDALLAWWRDEARVQTP